MKELSDHVLFRYTTDNVFAWRHKYIKTILQIHKFIKRIHH